MQIKSGPEATISKSIYDHSWNHLSDELSRLDLLISLQLRRQRNVQTPNTEEQLRGLMLSEDEILSLLKEKGPLNSLDRCQPSDSEERQLIETIYQFESHLKQKRVSSLQEGVDLSLEHLSRLFCLTPFEEQCLIICLAPEIDRRYEKMYAYLQDDVTRKKPSVDLVITLLCRTAQERLKTRLAFDPQAPMLKYRLLQVTDSMPDSPIPLLSRFLKLDDRIVNFLLGFGQMDARLASTAQLVYPQARGDQVTVTEEIKSRMRNYVRSHFGNTGSVRQNVVFYLYGSYGSGKRSLAELICHDLGLPLVITDVERMLGEQLPFEDMTWLLGREAMLQPASLCLENFDCLLAEDSKYKSQLRSLREVIQTFSRLTFLIGHRPWNPHGFLGECVFFDVEFPIPNDRERIHLWESHLSSHYRLAEDLDLGALASRFRFTPGQIQDALVAAQNLTRLRPYDDRITMADLYSACRAQSNQKLSTLARKIELKYAWDDIVLPSDQMKQLREICNQAKYRHIVYGEWGFDRKLSLGKGLNVLFSGPSGTGKTMAAEIIAYELGLDLYKIDLSQVVSKYIGETEKNLDKIFNEAQTSNAVLFFDEADALFGKRSEVKDAHDRYANIEIGYLLQKMEEYHGIAILATNLRQNMDEAFVRRIQVIVEFPFPDEEHRRRIWGVIFPQEAPIGDEVDFGFLAREIKLAGGNIKNIALAAAFYAAEDSGIVMMVHLVRAVRREYQKLGRTWNEVHWGAKGNPAPN